MALKKLASVIDEVQQICWDTGAVKFSDSVVESAIGRALVEISSYKPYEAIEVLYPSDDSKVLDISDISNLLWIDKLEYPVGDSPRNFRNFIPLDASFIEMCIATLPDQGGSGTLTGTVTFTSASASVSGSGTDFDGELEAGYFIKPSGGTWWYEVESITSDTALTLVDAVRSDDNGADTENVTQYCYEPVFAYCMKLHTLTDDDSAYSTLDYNLEELLAQLVAARLKMNYATEKVGMGGVAGREGWQAYLTLAQQDLRSVLARLEDSRRIRVTQRFGID